MPAQSRRSSSRPSRAQRRAGMQSTRTYNVPAGRVSSVVPRRSFAPEPQPVDHTVEFGFIQRDLVRILLWAAVIIVAMIVLAFVF